MKSMDQFFNDKKWSKSGSLLINPYGNNTSLLFYGDSTLVQGLELATTTDLINYKKVPGIWLPTRKDKFDSFLVEGGPPPLKLSNGNYLYLYNSARSGFNSSKPGYNFQYNIGFCILDGTDPTKIIQRSNVPILTPTLPWETGHSTTGLKLTPNVVFVQSMIPLSKKDTFLIFYGAADSVIGAAEISVTVNQ